MFTNPLASILVTVFSTYAKIFQCKLTSFSPGVSHPVALVPLTEENEDAMDNKTFQKLLRTVGIRAPADEQVVLSFRSFHIAIKVII